MSKLYQKIKEQLHELDKIGPYFKYGILLAGLTCWAAGGYLYHQAYTALKPFKQHMAEHKLNAKTIISDNLDKIIDEDDFYVQYNKAKYQAGALTTAGFSIGKVGTLLVIPSASLIYLKYKKIKKQREDQRKSSQGA